LHVIQRQARVWTQWARWLRKIKNKKYTAAGESLDPEGALAKFVAKTAALHPCERGLALEVIQTI